MSRSSPPRVCPSTPRPKPPARILVTGFEPFGGEDDNPSWRIAQALDGAAIDEAVVTARQLPCVFGEARAVLQTELRRLRPVLTVCLGQAGGREGITFERVAINVDDARIPDNQGAQPIDCAIEGRGPAAYFTRLPIKAMTAALRDAGYAAAVSQTAGTFVCNHVFYALMHALRRRPAWRGGFVHVPYAPGQRGAVAGVPVMALEAQTEAVRLALAVAWRTRADQRSSGGAEH